MTEPLFTCGACGYTCADQPWDEDLRERLAFHEAGHAAMNWHRVHDVSVVCLHPDGSGRCAHGFDMEMIDSLDHLFIVVAGPVGEVGIMGRINPAASQSHDFDYVRTFLLPVVLFRGASPTPDPADALQHFCDLARDALFGPQCVDLYVAIGEELLEQPWLSADALRTLGEAHARRAAEAEDAPA
jgi:hypothetical protein